MTRTIPDYTPETAKAGLALREMEGKWHFQLWHLETFGCEYTPESTKAIFKEWGFE